MRATYCLGLLASLLLFSGEARPCGGAFGTNYTIQPDQKIVVGYHEGIETYVFNPSFCGSADAFGLMLPIPSTLTASPTLGKQQLYTDLTTVTAPTIVKRQECQGKGVGGSASSNGGTGRGTPGGISVIQRGQVGIFDFALLKATDVSAFTTWLTTNGFPYQESAKSIFQQYVDSGWYFVAFKVSPGGLSSGTGGAAGATGTAANRGGSSGTSGQQVCGTFGPVALSFASASGPVIPARIASVSSSSLQWDVFAIASQQLRFHNQSATLRFSGELTDTDLTKHTELGTVAKVGDRLTELRMSSIPSADLVLEPDPNQADYRRVETQIEYIACAAGAAGAAGNVASAGAAQAGRGGTTASSSPIGAGGADAKGTGGLSAGGAVLVNVPAAGTASTNTVAWPEGGTVNLAQAEGGANATPSSGGSVAASVTPTVVASSNGGQLAATTKSAGKTGGSANQPAAAGASPVAARAHDDSDGCAMAQGTTGRTTKPFGMLLIAAAMTLFLRRRART